MTALRRPPAKVTLPAGSAAGALPRRVRIHEVGPRDGLQNEATSVETAAKAQFVRGLLDAGLSTVELTSFVRSDLVPQMADAAALVAAVGQPSGARLPVLVPNERGLDAALEAGVREVAVFASATEAFAERNLGRSVDASLERLEGTARRAVDAGLVVRGYVSMCFGDPWEGPVDPERVVAVGARLLEAGASELSLGDTIGVATAGQIVGLLDAFVGSGIGHERLAVHFHDTYGQALANALVALREGVTTVDASAGGLGGCPFAGSATGNLATEDLVWMLEGLGVETGVDLEALVAVSVGMAALLGRPSPSAVVRALGGAVGAPAA